MSSALLRFFGEFAIEAGPARVDRFDTQRSAKLIALLGLSRSRRLTREELADLLWPDDFPDATRLRFRQELARARKALGPNAELLQTDGDFVALDAGAVETDLANIARALRIPIDAPHRPTALRSALEGVEGEFLAGWDDPWVMAERTRAHTVRRDGFLALAQSLLDAGSPAEALAAAKRVIERDPVDVPARLIAIQAHTQLGSLTQALAEFQQLKRALREMENREPSPETEAWIATVQAGAVAPRPATQERTVPWRPIPAALSRTFGRNHDRGQIADCLSRGIRLVTLLGPGGIGKTHLALDVLRQLKVDYDGGVGMVALAELTDVRAFAGALLHQAGLPAPDNVAAFEYLGRALGQMPALVLLDNAEHLLPDLAGPIRELLEASPTLQILVTSRNPVGVSGEQVYRLRPLDAGSDGREMLFDLWRGLRPNLTINEESARNLDRLAARLDGYPLAIRLVAPRLKLRSPAEVLRELDQTPIAAPLEDLPERHRNLTALILASIQELEPARRAGLLAITPFLSGATIAQAVAAMDDSAAFDHIDSLVDSSLVVLDEGDHLRVRCLDLVRETVRQAVGDEERRAAELRFVQVMKSHIRSAITDLVCPITAEVIESLDEDAENVHEALRLSWELAPELHADLACAWWRLEQARGRYHQIIAMAESALPHANPGQRGELLLASGTAWASLGEDQKCTDDLLAAIEAFREASNVAGEAIVQAQLAHLERRTVSLPKAIERAEQAVHLSESSESRAVRAFTQLVLGTLHIFNNEIQNARKWIESADELGRNSGDDPIALTTGLRYLSILYGRDEHDQGLLELERLMPLAYRLNDPVRIAFGHEMRGRFLLAIGEPEDAEVSFRESCRIWQQLGNTFQMADQSLSIVRCLADQDRWADAEAWLVLSADLWFEASDFGGLCAAMSSLGRVWLHRGDVQTARTVFGYQMALARELGLILVDSENRYRDELHAQVGQLIEPAELASGTGALALFYDLGAAPAVMS